MFVTVCLDLFTIRIKFSFPNNSPIILFHPELGLAEHLDFVMTSEESKDEKPNRQIFDMAMEKTKCSDPATAYHVGTSIDYDVSYFASRLRSLHSSLFFCPYLSLTSH